LIARLAAILIQFERGEGRVEMLKYKTSVTMTRERVATILDHMGMGPKHVAIFWRESQKAVKAPPRRLSPSGLARPLDP
jgi:hypothetical protein